MTLVITLGRGRDSSRLHSSPDHWLGNQRLPLQFPSATLHSDGAATSSATSSTTVSAELGRLFSRRCSNFALPVPLGRAINDNIGRPFLPPEFDRELEASSEIKVPSFSSGGCMELMAVPKKKVSPHKRGIRNGPKALKPVPVIIRCKSCGRVKLPHFFCCSGDRGQTGERSNSTS
ncbi:hypothetical protein NE237_005659 [Protea cynaroides]|uniref:Large ribosomal subunit protein bL32m n=1 Tax=Protea cynaroides TaxID=273540 RepID=A0A9Q0KL69_9MAGN|nr:hypothetical protein NE237_005659 [Protea cynaroides]